MRSAVHYRYSYPQEVHCFTHNIAFGCDFTTISATFQLKSGFILKRFQLEKFSGIKAD